MWSEHCSYKSSKKYLRRLPSRAEHVLQGPGENAGCVSIGDGLAVVFKIESHNHPSFIEPRQGAATGVGGILRDIFTMGARPIASLDSLRFGPLEDPKHRYLLHGVVEGIGGYGNSVGVATVGGETSFHECYRGNIVVNAFNLGLVREEGLFLAKAAGRRQPGALRRQQDRARRHPRRQPAGLGRVRRDQRGQAPDRPGGRSLHREVSDRGLPRGDGDRRHRRHPGHGRGGAHLLLLRDGEQRGHRDRARSRPRARSASPA